MKIRKDIKIGGFAILMLALLYWGVNFLKGTDIFSGHNTYYASYERVNGLQKSAAVTIKGFKIGVVSDIRYEPSETERIIVEMNIRSKYRIPVNSIARIFSDGIIGGKAIEIIPGDSERILANGDTLHSEQDPDILEIAGTEFEVLKEKASVLFDRLDTLLASMNDLLSENTANINATVSNIAGITGDLGYVVRSEKEQLRSIISSINSISSTLTDNSARIENIITNVEDFSGTLAGADLAVVATQLSDAIGNLDSLISRVGEGEGTAGKLLNDQGLYDSLEQTAENLARLLEDIKENPGRYVNISVFGGRNKVK